MQNTTETATADEPSLHGYVRFIVLCAARTGSYMLTSSLNSSPNIICFGEVFNALARHVDYRVDGYQMHNPKERELRDGDFERFLRERIYTDHDKQVGAVGFKLPHSHFRQYRPLMRREMSGLPPQAENKLLEWLVAEVDIRVLHLRRRNVLRRMVSTYIARATGGWIEPAAPTLAGVSSRSAMLKAIRHPRHAVRSLQHVLFPKEPAWKSSRTAVELPEDECREFFAKDALDTAHYDELFSEHDVHMLYYEELVGHYGAILEGVQTFLGLDPRPLAPATRQQNPEPLRELIVNYDELHEAFNGSPEAAYFE